MKPLGESGKNYLEELKSRSKTSKVYQSYQLTGLEIANILEDWKHKSLYIKLAKEHGDRLLGIAKSVAEKRDVQNKGAYFMKVYKNEISNDSKQKG